MLDRVTELTEAVIAAERRPAGGLRGGLVSAAAERARTILVPLRAQPFLDRLEAAMSRVVAGSAEG